MGKINEKGYKQGIWNPSKPEKLLNKTRPVYRSQLEADFMRLLDRSPKIKKWGSEVYWITYDKILENGTIKKARYFVDFVVITDTDETILIEIKPAKQIKNVRMLIENHTLPKSAREKTSTWNYRMHETLMNLQKWKTAKEHCEQRGWKFQVLSEKDLKAFQSIF
jgi:hypothetical protein